MTDHIYINKAEILQRYQPIDKAAHKGTQGHALIIGGSYGKMGCMCLASKAAIKTGCGLVSVYVPASGNDIVQIAVPEVMVISDRGKNAISDIKYNIVPKSIGIGPGLGLERATQKALHNFLKNAAAPLVVDADALNIISRNQDWLSLLPPKTILTPHVRELERIIGSTENQRVKFEIVSILSKTHDLIFVLKGAPTYVIYHDHLFENTSGNPALATAGSGDVLTGMITSLMAQSYEPLDAAIMGVFLQGLTADIALPETGYHSFIASDIIANIGKAWLSVSSL